MLRRRKIRTKLLLPAVVAVVALGAAGAIAAVGLASEPDGDRASTWLGAAATVAGVGLLAVVFTTWRSVRAVVGPVRELVAATSTSAQLRIPHALDAAGSGAPPLALPPVEIDTRDELAEIAESFDELQRTAVTLVSEQSRTRARIEETFVNLGRRNQALLSRTLELLTALEERAPDEETLAALFRLDHLVTRMRRNAESLLVLAGTDPGRATTGALHVEDTLRAALSQVEGYERVQFRSVAPIRIVDRVAGAVAHLLAELIENATAFSPPDAPVEIDGTVGPAGYTISILDRGLGMTAVDLDAANRRLADGTGPWPLTTRLLGHSVVARIARRHAIVVRLRPRDGEGIVATVQLPVELVEPADELDLTAPERPAPPPTPPPPPPTPEPPPVPDPPPAPPPPPSPPPTPEPVPGGAGAPVVAPLERRVRGEHRVEPGLPPALGGEGADPDRVRVALAGLQAGVARARADRPLERRVRGASLPDTGPEPAWPLSSPSTGSGADERARALAGLQAGVARARAADAPDDPGGSVTPPEEER